MRDPLAVYLHDHIAGSRIAVELLGYLRDRHHDDELSRFAAALLDEVEEDRALVEELVERLGRGRFPFIKESVMWLGEKGIRLRLRLRMEDLGTFEVLEMLALGILGKRSLWRALEEIAPEDDRLNGLDFGQLAERAQRQHDQIEEHRLRFAPKIARIR